MKKENSLRQHMTVKTICSFLVAALILLTFSNCSKDSADPEDDIPLINDPFTEGTIEMGMYSHGLDLGYYIEHIDFSRHDIQEQLATLAQSAEGKALPDLINELGQRNPFLAFTLVLNMNVATYYIKDHIVLGKAKGFGWEMENLHDRVNDLGKVVLRTLVTTDQIAEEDKEIYASYTPSEDLEPGYFGYLDHSIFDRETDTKQENILGYACQKAIYTLKPEHRPVLGNPDDDLLFPSATLYKLVVYTSPQFDETINFTHPFYLPENDGILKLEIYYEESDNPTLVMQPKTISPRAIASTELQVHQGEPVYNIYDLEFGQKTWPIMFGGWGVLDEETP